ncbi:MAG: 2-C-methyl-D-erythritol 4-phosphate cytidylyltransferase [Cytophagaceae bacterium]
MDQLNRYALIVAGGSGTRMNSSMPKQFLVVAGKPILMHTIEKFLEADPYTQIILVLPFSELLTWKALCVDFNFHKKIKLAEGGKSRYESVRNGLKTIHEDEALVAIHDGVRPCISPEIINKSYEVAALYGNAIASVALKDSIRMISSEANSSVDRNAFRLIQTPQTFRFSLIKEAYSSTELPHFTDDASVAENAGMKIYLIEGSYQNIKITMPEDLMFAESLLG